MAENAVEVLFICSWIVACASYGTFSLNITTNPVELWANPTSESRIDKDYFDTHFQPFYRTEQIFIKTVGINPVRNNSYFSKF